MEEVLEKALGQSPDEVRGKLMLVTMPVIAQDRAYYLDDYIETSRELGYIVTASSTEIRKIASKVLEEPRRLTVQ
jgi:hypothetical protein